MPVNDTPIYQLPGIPAQRNNNGWGWEFAGSNGPTEDGPMYTQQERGVDGNYFGGPKMNVSAEMTYPPKRLT